LSRSTFCLHEFSIACATAPAAVENPSQTESSRQSVSKFNLQQIQFATAELQMLQVKLLRPGAKAPTVAHPGEDLGYDLYAAANVRIPAKGQGVIPTGIAVELRSADGDPMGALLRDRSSLAARRLLLTGGVIDAGYRGEIRVLMENLGEEPAEIHAGDKIANLIPYPVLTGRVVVVEELSETLRQAAGFGSTGRR
jgi:dUTP pyrophosphatase